MSTKTEFVLGGISYRSTRRASLPNCVCNRTNRPTVHSDTRHMFPHRSLDLMSVQMCFSCEKAQPNCLSSHLNYSDRFSVWA